jgi:purine-nucleoside phosphorylase
MLQKIRESVGYINSITSVKPRVGIILGTGLGNFADQIKIINEISFSEIPCFPVITVKGHKGRLLFGYCNGIPVSVMQGRVHFYEGFTMEDITLPVRVMKFLGVKTILLSNAAGGMNSGFSIGDLMVVTDHVHHMPNPLIGKHISKFGPRFPDMSNAYDSNLIAKAGALSKKLNISLRYGTYIGVTGPTYETPAEYTYFRRMGGDAIGMSTTPEVIVARQMGLRCFAISIITDLGIAGKIKFLTHEMVQESAVKAEPQLSQLFRELLPQC